MFGSLDHKQNTRFIASSKTLDPEQRFVERRQGDQKVMAWVAFTFHKYRIIFFSSGLKMDSDAYQKEILEKEVINVGSKYLRVCQQVFQHNCATQSHLPLHTAWLSQINIPFIIP